MQEYLNKSMQAKKKQADNIYKAQEELLNQQIQQAQNVQTQSNRTSANAYQKQINPYGVQAEQMATSGLGESGYKNRVLSNAYGAYQNALGASTADYLANLSDINTNRLSALTDKQNAYLDAENAYATQAYNEMLRLLELERQKERDKVADEQWQKQYNLARGV